MKLGERIKALRKQKNISQEVFDGYPGVSFQAVSKWENSVLHN
ncbi:MAG: helix-turn-helix domain-containing protein [Clostridiales bacterium]|nr:helix-turn-helix domain-containing protein [Clostridiales bacterium]